jgi:plastocyanin
MKSRRYITAAFFLILAGCKSNNAPSASSSTSTPTQAVAAVDPATVGTVTGSVKFTGTAPKAQKISMSADAFCSTAHKDAVVSEEVVVNANKTLRYVYVYVKSGLGDKKFAPSATPVVFDQKGCMYTPHVAAVQVGQEVVVRNSDGVLHNVNVRPTKNQGFNFGQPVQGMENKKTFTTAEVMIPVKCDVHPWMHGWIGVQDHPFAAVSDENGAFSLNNLPPGTYEIEAWHEKYGTSTQTVTVGAKETKSITFTFKGA